jgi:glycosyltransferase involved in cell wall biosynthesis
MLIAVHRHICFVAPAAWPVLSASKSIETVGGSEVQQCILARAFAQRGWRVSMICMNYGQPDGVEIDGIRVLRAHSPSEGIPVVRFLHPRLTSFWRAMGRVDADLYYERACGAMTGFVAAFCRRQRRRFVYAAASNADFDPGLPLIPFARDRALFRWGLQRADVIIAQNRDQQAACLQHYRRESTLVPNCYAPPRGATHDTHGYVLWVSTMRRLKRPELFLDLASRMPDLRFRLVGGPDDRAFFGELQQRARTLPNVDFLGFVPYADIERQFDGARLFVNTSHTEGFPNTFLQAWARAIPALSLMDFSHMCDEQPVVERADSVADLATRVRRLMCDDALWRSRGELSRRYFLAHHAPDHAIDALSAAIAGTEHAHEDAEAASGRN